MKNNLDDIPLIIEKEKKENSDNAHPPLRIPIPAPLPYPAERPREKPKDSEKRVIIIDI
jgi:hypothetical protein